MRKKFGIVLAIILSLSLLIYFCGKTNKDKLNNKNNFNVMSEEVKANIINKNSRDLYRDVMISQDNDFYGRKMNSQFSFTLLLDKDDKIKFQDPKNYEINFTIPTDFLKFCFFNPLIVKHFRLSTQKRLFKI